MTERVAQQPGLVLHTRPYRNTSLLVELFTRDYGRVGAVARGGRSTSNRNPRSALLQPFQPLLLNWQQRGDLASLTGLEADSSISVAPALRQSERLWYGLYLNELLMRFLHRGDAHVELYEHYIDALTGLAAEADADVLLRRFECRLLAEAGYGLPLYADMDGQPLRAEQSYRLDVQQGFVPVGTPGVGAEAFPGAMLIALATDAPLLAEYRSPAKRLLRGAIEQHLTKPLQTGAILRTLKQL